jgi:hypothetical protein
VVRACCLAFLFWACLPSFLVYASLLAFLLLLRCSAWLGRDTLYEIFVSTVVVGFEDGVLAVLVCSKKLLGNTMEYGNMQEKEQRSPWLAIRFGCCASKEDVVDNGKEMLRATGMYYFTCFHPSACPFPFFVLLFTRQRFFIPFRRILVTSFGLRRLTRYVEMHHAPRLHSP